MRNLFARIFYRAYKLCLPEYFVPDSDDIYLVSYPRSGNTWMRVIVSELLYGESGRSIQDLQFYIPDIYVKTEVKDLVRADHHVVKTHSRYKRRYRRVIYIIRDPRDVVLSYYRYQTELGVYGYGLDQFVFDWVNGRVFPCSWSEHVNSWTSDIQDSNLDLLLVRYEDLLSDTEDQVKRIAEYLGCKVAGSDVKRVIATSSVRQMRSKERLGMPAAETADEFHFIGPARSRQWLNKLSEKQLDYIVSGFYDTMAKHKYLGTKCAVQR